LRRRLGGCAGFAGAAVKTPDWGDRYPPGGATGPERRLPSSRVELASSATDRSKETNTANTVAHAPVSGSAGQVRAVSWRARMCVLAGVLVVAGLSSPGVARAAGPAGGGGLSEQVQLALSQLGAAVSSASSGAGLNLPSTVLRGAMPAAADGAIPTSVAAATQPVTTNSGPAATVWAAAGSPPSASLGTEASGQERGADSGRAERAQGSTARAAPRSEIPPSGGTATVPQSSVAELRRVLQPHGLRQERAPRERAKPEGPPAGVVPQRLPPRPLPPRPDMSSSGQAGGQAPPVTLPLAALVAVLSIFVLRFLPRAFPVPAFRKPRLTVTPAWNPG